MAHTFPRRAGQKEMASFENAIIQFPDFENSLSNEYNELFSSLLSSKRNARGKILLVARKRFCEVTALRNFVNVLARLARY